MRTSRIAFALVGVGLLAALSGCSTAKPGPSTGSAPTTTASFTLIVEPQPVYDFISSATKTLDMTMYSTSDPKDDA
jgi:hypothetical protein